MRQRQNILAHSCTRTCTITITRAIHYAHYPSCILLLVSRAANSILHYIRYICLHFIVELACSRRISNPSSFVKFDDTIRSLTLCLAFRSTIFCHFLFFFFWTKIHMEKSHGSHTVCLLSGTRVSNTIFFSYVQSAKYKSWPTASHHDLECINSELPSFVQVPTIGKSIFNRWITLRSYVHSAF